MGASVSRGGNGGGGGSGVGGGAPSWARLSEGRLEMLRLRETLKAKKELEGCTFRPILSTTSPTAVAATSNSNGGEGGSGGGNHGAPVYDRLLAQAEDREAREKARIVRELRGCTFSPKVNHRSLSPARSAAGPQARVLY
ncbi:unnamed protein product [Phaeothamnion confervicola]